MKLDFKTFTFGFETKHYSLNEPISFSLTHHSKEFVQISPPLSSFQVEIMPNKISQIQSYIFILIMIVIQSNDNSRTVIMQSYSKNNVGKGFGRCRCGASHPTTEHLPAFGGNSIASRGSGTFDNVFKKSFYHSTPLLVLTPVSG